MKVLNNNVTEVLPSLLDKSKVQSIRAAWNKEHDFTDFDGEVEEGSCRGCGKTYSSYAEQQSLGLCNKPSKFKVGERVKVVWDKDSKEEWFCKRHGNAIITNYSNIAEKFKIGKTTVSNFRFGDKCDCTPKCIYNEMDIELFNSLFFNKNFGVVEITEVFKIELWKQQIGLHPAFYMSNLCFPDEIELAKKDGFKSRDQMFETLSDLYDLSKPREFWVYRWVWR